MVFDLIFMVMDRDNPALPKIQCWYFYSTDTPSETRIKAWELLW